jgi:hypothetical protein
MDMAGDKSILPRNAYILGAALVCILERVLHLSGVFHHLICLEHIYLELLNCLALTLMYIFAKRTFRECLPFCFWFGCTFTVVRPKGICSLTQDSDFARY